MISVQERKLRQTPNGLVGLKKYPTKHKTGLTQEKTVYDLSTRAPMVRDQGATGECTGFGWSAVAYSYLSQDVRNELISKYGSDLLSPQFVYYHERLLEGTLGQDSGAYVVDGGNVLRDVGICPESLYPFNPVTMNDKPSQKAEDAAKQFRIKDVYRGTGIDDIKAALNNGNPVNIGVAVYESFESYDVANFGGIIPIPDKQKEKLLGYHDMTIFKSDDFHQQVKLINSWGSDWGDHGWCYLSYDYINDPELCTDIYIPEMEGAIPVIDPPKPWDGMTIDEAVRIISNCKFPDGTPVMDSPELWLNFAINSRDAEGLERFEELRLIKEAAYLKSLQS